MWYMHDGWGWWMVFGGIWMLLFWIAIIGLVVWGVRSLMGHKESRTGTPEKRDPLDIAKERYAKGEISKEQFEQIKKDLHSS
jgi:putative membrane protein